MVRLIQIVHSKDEDRYYLSDIFVNPGSVTYMIEDRASSFANNKSPLVEGLDRNHEFTKLIIDTGGKTEHVSVLGNVTEVANKLKNNKQLLRG
jgi:hypothetical protein